MFRKGLRINYCNTSASFLIVLFIGLCFEFSLSKNTNPSGVVRNLVASVFEDKTHVENNVGHGQLKLNITWDAPLNGRKPSSYSILITSVNQHDENDAIPCPEESLFYNTENGDRCHVVLPENKFFSEAPELSIRPTCTYLIQIFANPRGDPKLKVPEMILTVPECVGNWCDCKKAQEYLPVPEVNIVSQSSEKIVVEWHPKSLDSRVHSYIISFGVPFLISNNQLPVYNISKIANVPSTIKSFSFYLNATDFDFTAGGNVYVTAENNVGCLGKSGTALLERTIEAMNSIHRPDQRFQWLIWISVIGMASMILGVVFSFVYNKRQKKYKLIWSNQSMARMQGLIGLSRLGSRWVDSALRERNVLYVEQEIKEAIDRGEADEYEVSYDRLKFIRELGKGQFGKVYLGTLDGHGKSVVAIKILNCYESKNELEARQQLLAEIETMKNAGFHPHLVQLIATCTLPKKPICLVLEYLEGGDLLAHLHRLRDRLSNDEYLDSGISSPRSQRPSLSETICTTLDSPISETFPEYPIKNNFTDNDDKNVPRYVNINEDNPIGISDKCSDLDEHQFTSFALDIARGMEHLEKRGIIHRDLAARNILVSADMTLKISDFGLSRNDGVYIIGNGDGGVRRLPVRWMAPEALRDRSFTSKSDVWSFAIVLWEIGTLGAFPYSDVPDDMLLRHVLRDEGRLERPKNVTPEFYDIMRSCWSSRPENRPNFGQLIDRLSTIGEPPQLFRATSNPCYSLLPTMMTMEGNRVFSHSDLQRINNGDRLIN